MRFLAQRAGHDRLPANQSAPATCASAPAPQHNRQRQGFSCVMQIQSRGSWCTPFSDADLFREKESGFFQRGKIFKLAEVWQDFSAASMLRLGLAAEGFASALKALQSHASANRRWRA